MAARNALAAVASLRRAAPQLSWRRGTASGARARASRVAVYPGDGIGVDVTRAAFRVLEHTQRTIGGFSLDAEWLPWGCDYYEKHGVCAPPDMIQQLSNFDAIFLGAVGYPSRVPDHLTLEPLIRMRQEFDQYACVRPARTFSGVPRPLASSADIDMIVVRENSEGEYVNCGGRMARGQPAEIAVQSAVHTRRGVERIVRHGFELAMRADRRQRLCVVTKSNAQRYAMTLWDEVLEEIAPEYPAVAAEQQHVDAACMNFVRRPESFDIVVASNLFGDILTDLSGAVTGSLGLNPSANLNPERCFPSLFEPVHGSAPDIDGKGIANPVAAVLSAAMMLEWLEAPAAAPSAIRAAVAACLAAGESTPDAGGTLSTEAVTEALIARIA